MRRKLVILIVFLSVLLYGCTYYNNYCDAPNDCSRLNLMHAHCQGNWVCEQNKCGWTCDEFALNTSKETIYDLDNQIRDTDDRKLSGDENSSLVILMSKATCEDYGGFWNECVSSCRFKNESFCTAVCDTICMCGSPNEFTCPSGYYCKMYNLVTGEGECLPSVTRK
ncbi:MAG: hypothetical protein WC755_00860 [Candidatus Woesearchaeota archaeon]|jgi:hypothetical protein